MWRLMLQREQGGKWRCDFRNERPVFADWMGDKGKTAILPLTINYLGHTQSDRNRPCVCMF